MGIINQIVCEKRSYSREFNSHQHSYGQFLFPLQGTLDIKTNDEEIRLNSNNCLFLPPNYDHHYRSKDRNKFLILDIPVQYLPETTESMYIHIDKQWESIRYLLLEEAKDDKNQSSLVALTRFISSKLRTNRYASIDYIHKYFKEDIHLETLAKIEHYHPVYYSAWFKKKMGKGLKAYISDLRLKEAKHLLISTNWSMTKVSEEIGFENSSSFTRWFANNEGITPSNFRNLHKG